MKDLKNIFLVLIFVVPAISSAGTETGTGPITMFSSAAQVSGGDSVGIKFKHLVSDSFNKLQNDLPISVVPIRSHNEMMEILNSSSLRQNLFTRTSAKLSKAGKHLEDVTFSAGLVSGTGPIQSAIEILSAGDESLSADLSQSFKGAFHTDLLTLNKHMVDVSAVRISPSTTMGLNFLSKEKYISDDEAANALANPYVVNSSAMDIFEIFEAAKSGSEY